MLASLIIGYQFTTYYADAPDDLPKRVHLTRTIGGPLVNFIIAIAAFIAWQMTNHHAAMFALVINLFLASLLLLPFKGIDGEIFWSELRRK